MSHRRVRSIALLEPSPEGLHIFSRFALPRLGTVLLGTILRDLGYEVSVQVEDVRPFDPEPIRQADVVGLSTLTPTALAAYALAGQARARGQIVVLGGPHATHLPDEALDHADYVVRGEGEEALPKLLEAIAGERPLEEVPNLSYWKDQRKVHGPSMPLELELDRWPSPDLSLIHGFAAKNILGRRIVPIQTSRGCPHDCAFCSVTGTFGRKMRYRSPARVREQLAAYDPSAVSFFFYDDNFTASPRRTRQMLEMLRSLPGKLRWSAQVRADVARDEALLQEMAATGCRQVFIGLESVNQESLDRAAKRQTLDEVRTHVRRIHAAGIRVHGMFVFGFDTDRPDTPDRTVAFARELALSSVQFLVLTPLPGSRTYAELAAGGRLLSKNWAHYDAHHVVFSPRAATPSELQRWQVEGHRAYYRLWPTLKRRSLKDLIIAAYAGRINRTWQRDNAAFLEHLEHLEVVPQPRISGGEVCLGLEAR